MRSVPNLLFYVLLGFVWKLGHENSFTKLKLYKCTNVIDEIILKYLERPCRGDWYSRESLRDSSSCVKKFSAI